MKELGLSWLLIVQFKYWRSIFYCQSNMKGEKLFLQITWMRYILCDKLFLFKTILYILDFLTVLFRSFFTFNNFISGFWTQWTRSCECNSEGILSRFAQFAGTWNEFCYSSIIKSFHFIWMFTFSLSTYC